MTLPKAMATPTRAPTAPRPAPTPRAIALPASDPASAWAKMVSRRGSTSTGAPFRSVVLGDRAAEVDGGQRGEDERLQRRDEADLEEEQRHGDRQREPAEHLDAEQPREAAGHEED